VKQIIITVEDDEQVAIVLAALREAEENGDIDFAFGTKVEEVAE
jgi:DNA replication protein DnaD